MKYSAPIGGKYILKYNLIESVPTGKFELQKNIERKWYQFWKPKMVLREVYESKGLYQCHEIKDLKKGEEVILVNKFQIERIGSNEQ